MSNSKNLPMSFRTSIWLAYVIIVFEILYMISPFAFFFYSIYAVPLNWLQSSTLTSWLTTNILPHFTYQHSIFISILNLLSWPLIILGTLLFLFGFCQIYWAKIRRQGSVARGLYKYIRHPQYVALALTGLGAAIYWSRFIVWLMFATMIYLYYVLAKQEERICLLKFGDTYAAYLKKTGMFFPKLLESRLPRLQKFLPKEGVKRIFMLSALYCIYISFVVGFGFWMKNYALSKTTLLIKDDCVIVSVAPVSQNQVKHILKLIRTDPETQSQLSGLGMKKCLLYLIPSEWGIPELGIQRKGNKKNYLLHPETHGNSLKFDSRYFTVLVTEPILPSSEIKGKNILKMSLGFSPHLEVYVDLLKAEILQVRKRKDSGKWDGIPVPTY